MRIAPAAVPPRPDGNVTLGDNDPLLRQRVFQTCDLECARDYLAGVLVRSQFDYLSKERASIFVIGRATVKRADGNLPGNISFRGDSAPVGRPFPPQTSLP